MDPRIAAEKHALKQSLAYARKQQAIRQRLRGLKVSSLIIFGFLISWSKNLANPA